MTHSVSAESEPSSELFHQNLQQGLDLFFQRIFPPTELPPTEHEFEMEPISRITPESGIEEDNVFEFEAKSRLSPKQLLIQENILLRRVCSENAELIERLQSDKDELYQRLESAHEQFQQTETELHQQIAQLERKLHHKSSKKTRHLSSARRNKRRRNSFPSSSQMLENKFIEFKQRQQQQQQLSSAKQKSESIKDELEASGGEADCKIEELWSLECSSSQTLHCVNVINRPKDFLGLYFDSTLPTGVVVQHIIAGSVADRALIQPGDIIIEICGLNVRKANYRLAVKIINDCHEDIIQFRLLRQVHPPISTSSELALYESSDSLKKSASLRRRDAFLNRRPTQRSFYGRQYAKDLLLYQNANISLSIPRKIHLHHSLEKIQLLGGNAVGIFVHSVTDESLTNCLQTGDQLLEYNSIDLTQITAEDAAIELARPVRESVIVALFNLDGYNHIQESSLGDSFYIRAGFSRASINRSLEFKKGEILYVDNTLHDGKPGYWRAWKVNEFGEKIQCGIIPSKYSAENEIQLAQREYARNKFRRFRFFAIFRSFRILFRRPVSKSSSVNRYHKLITNEDTPKEQSTDNDNELRNCRVLASFTMQSSDRDCNNNNNNNSELTSAENSSCSGLIDESVSERLTSKDNADKRSSISSDTSSLSYCRVRKVQVQAPRPVIIFGPYSHLLVERLVSNYPQMFKACKREFANLSESQRIHSSTHNRHNNNPAVLSFEAIAGSIEQGLHPVLEGVENCLAELRSRQLFPIVIGMRFKSPRHIKDTVNQWTFYDRPLGGKRISNNLAKSSFKHQKQLELDWEADVHDFVGGNNHGYMCTRIKEIVQREQAKVIWQ